MGGGGRRRPEAGPSRQEEFVHDQGDDHLLQWPRNDRGHSRRRPRRRNLRRTRAAARRRRQRLQGPGLEGAARHAVVVHRHRPRARRLPLRRRRHRHAGGVRQARVGDDDETAAKNGERGGRAARTGPRQTPAENRRPAEGRPGDPRPGRQGAARHQGRPPHLARDDARPLPGVHADGRSRRRLAQDRVARGARPAARHRPRVPRGARLHRRRDHPHRRGGPSQGRHRQRPRGVPQDLDRDPPADRVVARARPSSTASRASSASCCAICSPTSSRRSGSTTRRNISACWSSSSASCRASRRR